MISAPDESYYQLDRSDVADLVPRDCRTILEIGSGFGALGRALKARQPCLIDGVEINPAAASHLSGHYRKYWIGDVERIELQGVGHDYDCLLFADVLEHLVDPWAALGRFSALVKPSGVVIASIPNVRNLTLLYRLLVKGTWEYEASGLMDRGHLRFFTRKSIVELFAGHGMTIEAWRTNRDRHKGFHRVLAAVAAMVVPDATVCQYLVRARKAW